MPRRPVDAASRANDGIWFQHRGLPKPEPLQRDLVTTTGRMLAAPFKTGGPIYPPAPPTQYKNKESKTYKISNNFSKHDNRHSFQDYGEYFGCEEVPRFLGKNNNSAALRQHLTGSSFLKHHGLQEVDYDYDTTTATDYRGAPGGSMRRHRRFNRNHPEGRPGPTGITADTALWHEPGTDYRPTIEVLTFTQTPRLPKSAWQYSTHGLPRTYPNICCGGGSSKQKGPSTQFHLSAPHVTFANHAMEAIQAHQ